MTRQEYNNKILKTLEHYVNAYPDWRFGQILFNSGLWRKEDPFFEESSETLKRIK
jgi:hypothetical protein